MDVQASFDCSFFDRRVADLLPAAARPVGLRDDGRN